MEIVRSKIHVRPVLVFKARKAGYKQAIRALLLARACCENDNWITPKRLEEGRKLLGIKDSSFYKWKQEALKAGFLRYNGKYDYYELAGWREIALICKVEKVDKFNVLMDTADLFREGYLSVLWAGVLLQYQKGPISRYKLGKITGVSTSQQLQFENHLTVEKTTNVAKTGIEINDPEAQPEPNMFKLFWDQFRFVIRLPDQRKVVDSRVEISGIGKSRKINRKLRQELGLQRDYAVTKSGAGEIGKAQWQVFHEDTDKAADTVEQLKKNNPFTHYQIMVKQPEPIKHYNTGEAVPNLIVWNVEHAEVPRHNRVRGFRGYLSSKDLQVLGYVP